MSENQNNEAAGEESGEKKPAGIADYLQGPRKKRKTYVTCCYGRYLPSDIGASIAGFVRANHGTMSLSTPKNPAELRRQFNRQIRLLIYDDEFCDLNEGLELLKQLKQHKHKVSVPVLFLTRRPSELVKLYNKILLSYHETDDYIAYVRVPKSHIISKVHTGITSKYQRRSRRYRVDIAISYFDLNTNSVLQGRILDLSIHGALLSSPPEHIFKPRDQLRLDLPVSGFLLPKEGDFLRLSARVRRVFISGNQAGISFEYVSEKQIYTLTEFLSGVVNYQVARKGRMYKARMARK